jgi:hypothetical protein
MAAVTGRAMVQNEAVDAGRPVTSDIKQVPVSHIQLGATVGAGTFGQVRTTIETAVARQPTTFSVLLVHGVRLGRFGLVCVRGCARAYSDGRAHCLPGVRGS